MPETQSANPPTFESVWASIQESRKEMQEYWEKWREGMQEFHEKMNELRESQKETDRQLKETERILKEDSQRLKEENDKRIGALTNLFDDLTEGMVAPSGFLPPFIDSVPRYSYRVFCIFIGENFSLKSLSCNLKIAEF